MSSFCTAKATHNFSAKNFSIFAYQSDVNFNESLTNDIVSFEQLGPGLYPHHTKRVHNSFHTEDEVSR